MGRTATVCVESPLESKASRPNRPRGRHTVCSWLEGSAFTAAARLAKRPGWLLWPDCARHRKRPALGSQSSLCVCVCDFIPPNALAPYWRAKSAHSIMELSALRFSVMQLGNRTWQWPSPQCPRLICAHKNVSVRSLMGSAHCPAIHGCDGVCTA